MAFVFNWPLFSPELYATVKAELTSALNAGERHPAIADTIVATDICFGSTPPKLDLVEISEVTEERLRGTFRLRYDGDGYIELTTKAQANPVKPTLARARAGRRSSILAAAKPLIVPIKIRISGLRLDGVGVLDMHAHRGTTLSFKNDPLLAVKINTSFDEQPAIQEMLQATLEAELRELFNRGLPELVHTLSLQHLARPPPPRAPSRQPSHVGGSDGQRLPAASAPTSPALAKASGRRAQRLGRQDSQPRAEGPGPGLAGQLLTLAHSHSTMSPLTVAPDHVAHRTALPPAITVPQLALASLAASLRRPTADPEGAALLQALAAAQPPSGPPSPSALPSHHSRRSLPDLQAQDEAGAGQGEGPLGGGRQGGLTLQLLHEGSGEGAVDLTIPIASSRRVTGHWARTAAPQHGALLAADSLARRLSLD